jgi:Ankyrin repeat
MEDVEDLPHEMRLAVAENDIPEILDWLGPAPVPSKRVNAIWRNYLGRTLLHKALFYNRPLLMRLLLQMGANVDARSILGTTPFGQGCVEAEYDEAARLLLTWGANTKENANIKVSARRCNPKLADLIEMPLGGRRCEIVGLQSRIDLNGRMGVATRYLAMTGRYILELENAESSNDEEMDDKKQVQVRPENLVRRDRTPLDCGSILRFVGVEENPGFNRNVFTERR